MKHRKEIDGLRAIAVLPVVLFHAGFTVFSGGYVGVDIFFVISGYLITTIIIAELDQGRFSIGRFYERRARRILPALFVMMACCIPFALMWMHPSQFHDFAKSIVAVTLFGSNFLFWKESGYFGAASEEKPLLHTWSLAVEEQYYLLFPIFLMLAWRLRRDHVFYAIVIIAAISLVVSQWASQYKPVPNFYLAPTRAWELLAGSICAFLQFGGIQKRSNLLSGLGMALILVAVFLYDEHTPFPSLYALAPVVGTALIILYAAQGTWTASLLSMRGFVGVGLISYSAYLWHQPLFAFARIRSIQPPEQWLMTLLAVIAFVLAYLTWRYVEQPFRARPKPALPSQKAVFATSGLLGGAFLALGLLGPFAENSPVRHSLTDAQRGYLATALPSPKREECHTGGYNYTAPANGCEYFGKQVKVAVLGDSHTVELSYALATKLKPTDIGVKHLSFSDCNPIMEEDVFSSPCSQWTHQAIAYLIQNETIEDVVISYRINAALFGGHTGVYPNVPQKKSDEERVAIFESLVTMTRILNKAGKNVIFVMQSPEVQAPIKKLAWQFDQQNLIGVNRAWWDERSLYIHSRMSELSASAEVIDPTPLFCDEHYCYAGRNGTAFYFDDDHLSSEGAGLVAADIVPHLLVSGSSIPSNTVQAATLKTAN